MELLKAIPDKRPEVREGRGGPLRGASAELGFPRQTQHALCPGLPPRAWTGGTALSMPGSSLRPGRGCAPITGPCGPAGKDVWECWHRPGEPWWCSQILVVLLLLASDMQQISVSTSEAPGTLLGPELETDAGPSVARWWSREEAQCSSREARGWGSSSGALERHSGLWRLRLHQIPAGVVTASPASRPGCFSSLVGSSCPAQSFPVGSVVVNSFTPQRV